MIKWKEVVTKLLNKAANEATSTQEAEALTEKAAYLIGKFGIQQDILDLEQKVKPNVQVLTLIMKEPYINHKLRLLAGISMVFSCQTVEHTKDMQRAVSIFGYKDDLEKVKMFYVSLLVQALYSLTSIETPPWENGKSYRNSWWLGYVTTVYKRLREAVDKGHQDTMNVPGVALVLADKKTHVKTKLAEVFPKIKTSKYTPSARSTNGYTRGSEAGRQADLGQEKIGGQGNLGIRS